MGKWTKEEIDAIKLVNDLGYKGVDAYHKWGEQTGYSKNYNAWEVKRRRIAAETIVDDTDREDELSVLDDFLNHVAPKFPDLEQPHLGKKNYPSLDMLDYNLKIGFFDIESTDLKGNFGRILCASFANQFGEVTTLRGDDPAYRGSKVRDDSRLVAAVRDMVESFDYIITWNGKKFDIPFLDTRLLLAGERPVRKDIMHTDLMYKAKMFSLTLHSARLDAVAKTFRLPVQKTPLDPETWLDAAMSDTDAMEYIVQHCEADVLVLREVYRILKPLIKIVHR
jgi:uncharacterized protein YprB with RNaseH-like and TPR domain